MHLLPFTLHLLPRPTKAAGFAPAMAVPDSPPPLLASSSSLTSTPRWPRWSLPCRRYRPHHWLPHPFLSSSLLLLRPLLHLVVVQKNPCPPHQIPNLAFLRQPPNPSQPLRRSCKFAVPNPLRLPTGSAGSQFRRYGFYCWDGLIEFRCSIFKFCLIVVAAVGLHEFWRWWWKFFLKVFIVAKMGFLGGMFLWVDIGLEFG